MIFGRKDKCSSSHCRRDLPGGSLGMGSKRRSSSSRRSFSSSLLLILSGMSRRFGGFFVGVGPGPGGGCVVVAAGVSRTPNTSTRRLRPLLLAALDDRPALAAREHLDRDLRGEALELLLEFRAHGFRACLAELVVRPRFADLVGVADENHRPDGLVRLEARDDRGHELALDPRAVPGSYPRITKVEVVERLADVVGAAARPRRGP